MMITFCPVTNRLISKTTYTSDKSLINDLVNIADHHGFKCFYTYTHNEYNTPCFSELGNCTNQEVQTFLKHCYEYETLWIWKGEK